VPAMTPPELNGESVIYLDAETTGLEWWNGDRPVGWAYCLPASGRRGYVSFGHASGNSTDQATALRWAQRELRNVRVCNANTKFDLHISREWGADLVSQGCTFGDVQHQAALLDDHRMRFNIDLLGQDFLGRGKVDFPFDKSKMAELSADQVAEYAIGDVVLVQDLENAMTPEIARQDLTRVLELEERIIPIVVEMEKNGVHVDMERLFLWQMQSAVEYEEQMWFIYKETGIKITSPDSSKEAAALFKARGIPITAFTGSFDKQGNPRPSFTDDVLKRASEHDAVIKAFYYAGQLADLRSKYINKYAATVRRTDGWMRFNLHQLRTSKDDGSGYGTVSGRFSSAGDKDKNGNPSGFNKQQVVSADKQTARGWCQNYVVRDLFLPGTPDERASDNPPVWLAADAKQIEYRIFAHFSNEEEILAKYAEDPNTDYHNVVQEILRRAKPDIQRKKTKITNFCKLFGAGLLKFAWTLETISDTEFARLDKKYKGVRGKDRLMRENEPTLAEGIDVYDTYDRMFPAAVKMLQLAKRVASERGHVTTMLGRRARFDGQYKRVHSALNRVIQGTAADLNKLMLVDLYEHRKEFDLRLRLTVHDEVDCDMFNVSKLPALREFFDKQRLDLKVPILWDVAVGPSWAGAKGKA
jgi:DNA polymerase-1